MSVVVVGLSHHTAPLELLERMAMRDERLPKALGDLVAHMPRTTGTEESVSYALLRRHIASVLASLPERERTVLRLRFARIRQRTARVRGVVRG